MATKSVEAGRRVRLPAGAEAPIDVFVNGSVETEGEDYTLRGNEILFNRTLYKEEVSKSRWLAMSLGLFGSYERHDTVDVDFHINGERRSITGAEVLP
ncbi:MAG: hypothetical protein M3O25_10405 [Actinomycetota bacterium]|nr:hypothetical protein [Actinomycetota bacterium]